MINHVQLPEELKSYIKQIDYESLGPKESGHKWNYISIHDVLTVEGIRWFLSRKIFLRGDVHLFRLPKHSQGAIHIDGYDVDSLDYAFNFVVSGYGEMQWIDNIVGQEQVFDLDYSKYVAFNDVTSCNIVDTWDGDMALVRINVPHRIVTSDKDRYCISLRTLSHMQPKTFDEVAKLIYN
jgi:hypothetical protein